MAAIELRGVTKEYGDETGIDSVTFSVREGEVFGLLGPPKSGKTTTIRTLLGIQSPTAGEATVLGFDPQNERDLRRAKAAIGYLPASPAFDETATGTEILDSHGHIKDDNRREELLARFDLPVDRRVCDCSMGDIQKLALVGAFMHDPALVIMDEPTAGLDPLDQQRLYEFIREEQQRGVTVFVSSCVLSEVRRLCDRVAILQDGRLLGTQPVESLRDQCGKVVHLRIAKAVDASTFDFEGVHDLSVRTVAIGDEREPMSDGTNGETTGTSNVVTAVSFAFTGDINTLVASVSSLPLLTFDLEEAPLETVFRRLYDDTTA